MSSKVSFPKFSLKLMLNKANGTLLFAEAEKDFVDFLLSILTCPVGKIMQLLKASNSGGLGKIYKSLVSLSDTNYLQHGVTKDSVLKTGFIASRPECFSLLTSDDKHCFTSTDALFCCSNRESEYICVSDVRLEKCHCSKNTDYGVAFFPSRTVKNGYAKDKNFMVMDDLTVCPMSISNIAALLDRLNVQFSSMEGKVVSFSREKVTKLLRASLAFSNTVLSDLYISESSKPAEALTCQIQRITF